MPCLDDQNVVYPNKMRSPNSFLTVAAAANEVDVSRQTVYRWIAMGRVPSPSHIRQRDGCRMFTEAQVEAIRQFAHAIAPVPEPLGTASACQRARAKEETR